MSRPTLPQRLLLCLLLLTVVTSCSMAGLAYDLAPSLAVRYADDYLDLSHEQEARAKRLFLERRSVHAHDELPRYHALLQQADAAIRSGIEREDVDALFNEVRRLYRLGVKRTIPQVAAILADVNARQIDVLAERLAEEAQEDRERIGEEGVRREIDETIEDIEEWIGPLSDAQRRLVSRRLRELEATRTLWVGWRIANNEQLVKLLREQATREDIEAFLTAYWVERSNMPEQLAGALVRNGERYQEMIVALDGTLSAQQREKALERIAEYRGMVIDMMPADVRTALREGRSDAAQGNAGQ